MKKKKFKRKAQPKPRDRIFNRQLTSQQPLVKTDKLMSNYNNNNGNGGNGKRKPGRPPSYKPEYAEQAYVMCKNHGATMEDLGEALGGKSYYAVWDWMNLYPEFAKAVKDGTELWRNTRVEDTLVQRAMGYEYEEVSVEQTRVAVTVPEGSKVWLPAEKTRRTIRHVAPSDVAIIFWLKNRASDRWKDVREFEGRFSKKEISLRLQADLKSEDLKQLGVGQLEKLASIVGQIEGGSLAGHSGESAR